MKHLRIFDRVFQRAFRIAVLPAVVWPGDARAITFTEWQESQFSPAEMASPAVSARSADPDNDGRTNLLEFALGTDPKMAESGLGFVVSRDSLGRLNLEYRKWKDLSGTVLFPQITSSLNTFWQAGDARWELVSTVSIDSDRDLITLRDTIEPLSAPKRFVRFLVDTDEDLDGLPDGWELLNGLSPFDRMDWASDVDGDGRTAFQEFLDGTDALIHDVPPPAVEPPSAPAAVNVTVYGDGSRLVQWVETSDNHTFFRIVETLTDGTLRELGRVGPNQKSFLIPANR